jgi:hypothetical protein
MIRAAAALLVLALASPAAAQDVGVHAEGDGHRLARRLVAELGARGYDVHDLAAETVALDTLDAVLWARDEPPHVRVCVSASDARPIDCEDLDGDGDDVLLIRTIELVRAHLGDPAPAIPAAVPPPEPPPAPPPRREWELGVAGAALLPTGNFSTGAAAVVAIDWVPDPWLAIELGGLASLVDATVDAAAGSASTSPRMAWLGVDLRIPESLLAGHHLAIGAQAGCGGSELHARPTATFSAHDSSFVALVLLTRASFVLRIVDGVGLSIGTRVGAALPQPVLVFDGHDVATWGAPFADLELGVVLSL